MDLGLKVLKDCNGIMIPKDGGFPELTPELIGELPIRYFVALDSRDRFVVASISRETTEKIAYGRRVKDPKITTTLKLEKEIQYRK